MARAHQSYMGGKSFCRITRTAKIYKMPAPTLNLYAHAWIHPLPLYLAHILLKIMTKSITISRISVFMCAHTNLIREIWGATILRVFTANFFVNIVCEKVNCAQVTFYRLSLVQGILSRLYKIYIVRYIVAYYLGGVLEEGYP